MSFKKGKYHINVGRDNGMWKGGFPRCLDCGKELKTYGAKRCNSCSRIYI